MAPGAPFAHAKEFLNRPSVEMTGFHRAQGFQNFVKSMEPSGLVRHTENLPLLYMRE